MPLPSPRPVPAAVGRRALVSGLAGAAVVSVTGCERGTSAGGAGGVPRTVEAQEDADLALVREALEVCRDTAALLGTLSTTGPVRARLAPLVAMHQSHATALRDAVPGSAAGPGGAASGAPVGPASALAAAVKAERDAHARLVALAQRALSGRLARLLASMAAGISQRLVELAR